MVEVKTKFKDLKALADAACALGLEFRENQRTHKWFGHFMGDSPLPEGVTAEQLGKCDHALHVTGNDNAYEIGIVDVGDGTYALRWDFWQGGFGLQEKVGDDCAKLVTEYQQQVIVRTCENQGWVWEKLEGGDMVVYPSGGGSVTVKANGQLDANGFVGSGCSQATAPLIEALGIASGEHKKIAYTQTLQEIGQL